jgi:predicted ribosomally synthesized peptide with nif11-like leader
MSIESAKAYLERIKSDPDFASKVSSLDSPEEKAALIKAEGFDLTGEEIGQLRGALSDDELGQISAGAIYIDGKPPKDFING